MALVTAIFQAIAGIPKLLELIKEFSLWVSRQIEEAEKRKLEREMKEATERAKKEKDTSKIDDLFNPRK